MSRSDPPLGVPGCLGDETFWALSDLTWPVLLPDAGKNIGVFFQGAVVI
jgi:hypothetical protein